MTFTAQNILSDSHGLEVTGIYATTISTLVIYLQSGRYRADVHFVGDAMR